MRRKRRERYLRILHRGRTKFRVSRSQAQTCTKVDIKVPGGTIEVNELLIDALYREITDETIIADKFFLL